MKSSDVIWWMFATILIVVLVIIVKCVPDKSNQPDEICYRGVVYLEFPNGVVPFVDADGNNVVCEE